MLDLLSVMKEEFRVPIFIPCNYSQIAQCLMTWLRKEVRDVCAKAKVEKATVKNIVGRIHLLNQEQVQGTGDVISDPDGPDDSSWSREVTLRCLPNPNEFA